MTADDTRWTIYGTLIFREYTERWPKAPQLYTIFHYSGGTIDLYAYGFTAVTINKYIILNNEYRIVYDRNPYADNRRIVSIKRI